MLGARTRVLGGLAAASMLLLSGCGQSADAGSSDDDPAPALLSAAKVGGTTVDDAARLVASAGPDGTALLGGSSGDNTAGFRRTTDGEKQLVLLGSWDRTASSYRDGMASLKRCLVQRKCSVSPPGFTGKPVADMPDGSYGFTTVRTDQDGQRVSVARSYTRVGDALVLVSIEHEGSGSPSAEQLRSLTSAQVGLTRSHDGS